VSVRFGCEAFIIWQCCRCETRWNRQQRAAAYVPQVDYSSDPGDFGLRSSIPVCSTTRIKSAIVFSLMVGGSASLHCVIFGRLWPVRIGKRGAMAH